MRDNFNMLTAAETERLAMLAEEAAEIIQVVGKILRHGYDSTHPENTDGPDNRELLQKELGDFELVKLMMCRADDVDSVSILQWAQEKSDSLQRYLHHNTTIRP